MDLTPEERERIYLEEKARHEARERVAREAAAARAAEEAQRAQAAKEEERLREERQRRLDEMWAQRHGSGVQAIPCEQGGGGNPIGWVLLGVLTLGYLAPAAVAGHRRHRNSTGIFLVNLFFGWTLIGWVVALVWAVSYQGPPVVVNVQTGMDGRTGAPSASGATRPIAESCPQCGKPREATLTFCRNCGASLAS
jgi:hypothetical protein